MESWTKTSITLQSHGIPACPRGAAVLGIFIETGPTFRALSAPEAGKVTFKLGRLAGVASRDEYYGDEFEMDHEGDGASLDGQERPSRAVEKARQAALRLVGRRCVKP